MGYCVVVLDIIVFEECFEKEWWLMLKLEFEGFLFVILYDENVFVYVFNVLRIFVFIMDFYFVYLYINVLFEL